MIKSKAERDAVAEEVREAYDDLQARKRKVREVVMARLSEEVDKATAEMVAEFSKTYLHANHDRGMPWHVLSAACRKYSNGNEFKRLRDAYLPLESMDLRTMKAVVTESEKRGWEWVDDTTLQVWVGGENFVVNDVMYMRSPLGGPDSDEYDEWAEFDMPNQYKDQHYTAVAKLVEEALHDRSEEEEDAGSQ